MGSFKVIQSLLGAHAVVERFPLPILGKRIKDDSISYSSDNKLEHSANKCVYARTGSIDSLGHFVNLPQPHGSMVPLARNVITRLG